MKDRCEADDKIDLRLAVGFGVGSLGMSIVLYMPSQVLAPFMTNFLGISANIVATMFLLTKTFDLVTDPIMGIVSDRTRSPCGRRRVYLIPGGAITALGLVILFNPVAFETSFAAQIQMLVGLFILYAGYTLFSVPYLAMPAEMTTQYHDRTKLMAFRVGFLNIGGLIMASSFALIEWLGDDIHAHGTVANGFAVLIFMSCAVTFFATARVNQTYKPERRVGARAQIRSMISNRPLRIFIGAKGCQLLALSVSTASGIYFKAIVLELSYTVITSYFFTVIAAVLLTLPIWSRASRAFGKRNVYMVSAACYGLVALSWLLAAPGDPSFMLYIRAAALGAFGSGVLVMAPALLPDVMEYDYLITGLRREGVLSALYSSIEKLAFALGPVIVLYLLSWAGYEPGVGGWQTRQPPGVTAFLYGVVSVFPAALYGLSLIFLARYDLSEAHLKALRSAYEKEHA